MGTSHARWLEPEGDRGGRFCSAVAPRRPTRRRSPPPAAPAPPPPPPHPAPPRPRRPTRQEAPARRRPSLQWKGERQDGTCRSHASTKPLSYSQRRPALRKLPPERTPSRPVPACDRQPWQVRCIDTTAQAWFEARAPPPHKRTRRPRPQPAARAPCRSPSNAPAPAATHRECIASPSWLAFVILTSWSHRWAWARTQ